MLDRFLYLMRNSVLVVFVLAIGAGIALPVYTDEVGWRFQERAGFDGVDKMFNDLCGPASLATPPFFMWPARYYSSFFNGLFAEPFYVRLSGIIYLLGWITLFALFVQRIAAGRARRDALLVVGIALMGLGVLPMLLLWSRPEQPILLATVTAMLVACADLPGPPARTPPAVAWRRSLIILLLATIALSYHIKGLILVPLFLACLFLASRGRAANLPRLLAGGLLLGMSLAAAAYWRHRFECPGDPVLAAVYAGHNLGARLLQNGGWAEAVPAILGNISLAGYVLPTAPSPNPMSAWLPLQQISSAGGWIWFRLLMLAWTLSLGTALTLLILAIARGWREHRLDPCVLLSLVLIGCAAAWSASQLVRNDYEASFVLPIVMLGIVAALSTARETPGRHLVTLLAMLLGPAMIASVALVAGLYAPAIARTTDAKGYVPGQPHSIAVFGYRSLEPDIIGAARQCRITDRPRPNALVIDDLTYFAFMRSTLPQHQLGVLSIWRGSIDDPVAYLRQRRSDGIIIGCHLLSPELRRRARQQGEFCCLGPPGW